MAGILNSKERVMDFIITQEGKRQAGIGDLRVKFASFTDYHTFYEKSGSLSLPDLADDTSDRIFFEAYSRYQDVIVPELEAGTSLRPFRTADFQIAGKVIASGTFQVGFVDRLNVLTGSDLPDAMPYLLDGIGKNFADQKIIGSVDEYNLDSDFQVVKLSSANGNLNTDFTIDNFTDYLRTDESNNNQAIAKIEDLPSIFNDGRFSRFPNFTFLPPQNLPDPGFSTGSQMGNYPMLDENFVDITFEEKGTIASLKKLKSYLKDKQKTELTFNPTSRTNNFVCQFFEAASLGVDKLSIVEFGQFSDENPSSPESLQSPGQRVFFVGKMRRDSTGAETFVCLFTVIID